MKQICIFFILVFSTYSCLDSVDMPEGEQNKKFEPTVTTVKITPSPTEDKLLFCEGLVVDPGASPVINKGFCWSTTNKIPTVADDTILSHMSSDYFNAYLTDIAGSKTYYIRAFAQNSHGYSYGDTISYIAPEVWEKKSSFPPRIRTFATTFTLGYKLYITCGQDASNLLGDTWEFNIAENRWIARPDYPGEKRRQAASFIIDTVAYVGMGGEGRSSIYWNDLYGYGSESENWNPEKISFPLTKRAECIGFSFQKSGYLVGGRISSSGQLSEVWKYTPLDTPQWKPMNDFPVKIYYGIGMVKGHERVFAGFGKDTESKNPIRNLWEYDVLTDTWNLFTTAPEAFGGAFTGSGTIIEDKAYIVDALNKIWELDLKTAEWKIKATLPDAFKKSTESDISQYIYSYNHSIFVGLNNTDLFYEYRPLWDDN